MNEKLLDDYISAWNSRDTIRLMSFFSKDVLYEDMALKKSLDYIGLKNFIVSSFDNNTELRFEKVSACITPTNISWEWTMHRTRNTEEKKIVPGMSMTEFQDGKIIRNRDYWSTLPTPH